MLGRQLIKSITKIPVRTLTSGEKVIDLSIDDEGIAVISCQKRPVNSYNLEFFREISKSVDDVENDEKCKGLIMTSAIPKIFSAGLDLSELYKPDPERLRLLGRALQDLYLKLHGSEVATTVAINGYASAGACIVSLMCDYRVMVNDNSKIGLNDTSVGIVPQRWVCELMNRAMGQRQAEIAITSSRMYMAEEALKVQMIDEIATDKEDAIEKCKKYIRQYDNIPRNVQSTTKRQLRESALKNMEENQENNIEVFMKSILNSRTQEQLGKYIDQLKQKKVK